MISSISGLRALVTGATGLIGSWLVPMLLRSGCRVSALIPDWDPQSELIRSGIVTECRVFTGRLETEMDVSRAVSECEQELVFNLGAQPLVGVGVRNPVHTFRTNIQGTWNVLEATRLLPSIRAVVVASSDKAYGATITLPYTEHMPVRAGAPYETSKACADLLTAAYAQTYGLPTAITRCGNVFGGGDLNWTRIVPGTIRSIIMGVRPVIRSDGTQVRDYVYVEDIARAYVRTAEALVASEIPSGQAFNFSNERPMSVMEIFDSVCGAMDAQVVPSVLGEARTEIDRQYLDSSKARSMLGWSPAFDLERALRNTIEWYEGYFSSEDRDPARYP